MTNSYDEPYSPGPLPLPCPTPHSAPVKWLKSEPPPSAVERPAADVPAIGFDDLPEIAARLRSDPKAMAELIALVSPEQERGDGWSPFARKLFLQVLAETGKVTTACEYTHLSRRSAYDLRNRDPLFAAGWDAACHLARNPLADTLREQSVDGVTDTITRNGEIVAERHRYDMRLSMAVLARLDKRCDRAEELGSKHVALVRNWDEWLNLVGKGDEAAARTLLETGMSETAQHCADCEVPESENPTAPLHPPGCDPSENCWRAGSADDLNPTRGRGVAEGAWITVYPPPPGF
ncbi:MAG TPA: hypothetical protein VG434_03595, partial [Sphingomicrobium sp.]|nr:hypothetical protein [Sphingomicrobium sp.]